MIGVALGSALRKLGRVGRSVGRSACAAFSAACTSPAARSMRRSRSNCSVMFAMPTELVDQIRSTPEIAARRRSSGAVTDAAITPGSAPGRLAVTWIVGYSMAGRLTTGRNQYATAPARSTARAIRVVATGRRTNGSEMLIRFRAHCTHASFEPAIGALPRAAHHEG